MDVHALVDEDEASEGRHEAQKRQEDRMEQVGI